MPAAARLGDSGVPHCSSYVIATGSPNVFINGRPAASVGDITTPHLMPASPKCVTHVATITTGSPRVLVNGRPMATLGSVLAGCTVVATGSFNVIAGI